MEKIQTLWQPITDVHQETCSGKKKKKKKKLAILGG
jgi:hypothetical protein